MRTSKREQLRELALFSGIGGGILGGKLLGWRTVCAVEINAFCARRLMQRQNEGHLSPFPIWDDVRTFDGRPWQGLVDVVSGGFPCQDISSAGQCKGIEGERSGLWKEMARIISEVRPKYAFMENSPMLTIRGLGTVLGDLAEMGFDARWGVLGAKSCGGPLERKRIWIAGSNRKYGETGMGFLKDWEKKILRKDSRKCPSFWLQAPSRDIRMVDGMGNYMDRVEAIGNGQVPAVVRLAWKILSGD